LEEGSQLALGGIITEAREKASDGIQYWLRVEREVNESFISLVPSGGAPEVWNGIILELPQAESGVGVRRFQGSDDPWSLSFEDGQVISEAAGEVNEEKHVARQAPPSTVRGEENVVGGLSKFIPALGVKPEQVKASTVNTAAPIVFRAIYRVDPGASRTAPKEAAAKALSSYIASDR
jgi:hypothetical protein